MKSPERRGVKLFPLFGEFVELGADEVFPEVCAGLVGVDVGCDGPPVVVTAFPVGVLGGAVVPAWTRRRSAVSVSVTAWPLTVAEQIARFPEREHSLPMVNEPSGGT